MLEAYKGVSFQPWLRGSLEGISPEQLAPLFGFLDLLRPGVLLQVVLLARLKGGRSIDAGNVRGELKRAGFSREMLLANVRSLARLVRGLTSRRQSSEWSGYTTQTSYSEPDREAKQAFVDAAARTRHWRLVWDLGCNAGELTERFAAHAQTVVGMDADPLAIDRFYRRLESQRVSNVLPLVSSVSDGFAGLGFRGTERKSLLARGQPELVVALALVHHLTFSAGIPLTDFVEWVAGLGGDLLTEFVDREDPMAQRVLRNATRPHPDYRREVFEALLHQRFASVEQLALGCGTRTLYFCRRSSGGSAV
jgi:hypothetical protein